MSEQKLAKNHAMVEIDLVEIVCQLLRKAKWIVLSALVCALLAGGYAVFTTNQANAELAAAEQVQEYSATARIYYLYSYLDIAEGMGYSFESNLAADLKAFALSRSVLQPIMDEYMSELEEYMPEIDYADFLDMIAVSVPTSTHLLDVTVTSEDAALAIALSNAIAQALCDYAAQAMDITAPTVYEMASEENVLEIELEETLLPESELVLMILVGAVLGAGLSVCVILFWAPVAGFVQAVKEKNKELQNEVKELQSV